jgi:hypothetical protein
MWFVWERVILPGLNAILSGEQCYGKCMYHKSVTQKCILFYLALYYTTWMIHCYDHYLISETFKKLNLYKQSSFSHCGLAVLQSGLRGFYSHNAGGDHGHFLIRPTRGPLTESWFHERRGSWDIQRTKKESKVRVKHGRWRSCPFTQGGSQ